MSEVHQIVFTTEHNRNIKQLREMAHQWFEFNKDHIRIISGIYNVKKIDEPYEHYHESIVIRYEGTEVSDPQECQHLHTKLETINPTCSTAGSIQTICEDCGVCINIETLPKVDHNWIYVSNNDATCTEDGTKTGTCSYCNEQIIVPDPDTAFGHEYVFTPNNDATCTEDGTETGRCKEDDSTITRVIPGSALGHDYQYISDNNATCTEDGTETAICPRCGDQQTRIEVGSALGHDIPDNWTTRVAPTCTESGIEFRKCTRCDYEETRVIDALGHDMSGDWIVRTPASCTNEGVEFRKCNDCDYEQTRAIIKLSHNWISNGDGTHTCKTTGGCGVSETCSPNTPGATCTKCGYITPSKVDFEITTEYINGMTVGTAFSQQITTSLPNGSDVDWDLKFGSVPIGLVFYRTGVLAGTPQVPGVFTFTIVAKYGGSEVTKEFTVNVASVNYIVTFDTQGGTCSETSRTVSQGSTIGELPTPTREGYEFGGWFTAAEGGLKIDPSYSVSSNVTLYARWGQGTDIEFGEATSQFNMQYNGDRTNYANQPYTIYHRVADGATGTSNLITQVGISSTDGTNDMTDANKKITLYLKVTNNGNAGNFDIGFDCDSYVAGSDKVIVTIIDNGVKVGNTFYTVTVPYEHSIWVGYYADRTQNRYTSMNVGEHSDGVDSGYAFTMKNIFINSGSYVILEVIFQKP